MIKGVVLISPIYLKIYRKVDVLARYTYVYQVIPNNIQLN